MSIGIKLRNLRNLRGMTMKELGVAAGFPAGSADVRIAQYEADSRIPKPDVIDRLALALKVHPQFLATSEATISQDIMHLLLSLDKENSVRFHEQEYTNIQGEKRTESYITDIRLSVFLADWNNIKKALQRGEITLEQYNEWRMNWPDKPEWMEDSAQEE